MQDNSYGCTTHMHYTLKSGNVHAKCYLVARTTETKYGGACASRALFHTVSQINMLTIYAKAIYFVEYNVFLLTF